MLSSYIPTGGDSIAQQESRGEVVAVAPTVEAPSVGAEGYRITARGRYDRVEGTADGLSTSLDIAQVGVSSEERDREVDLIKLGPHALIAVAPSGLLLYRPMKERIELGRWSTLYLQPLPVGEGLEYPSCRRFLWVSVEVP